MSCIFAVDPAEGRNNGPEKWIADTGCGDDLCGQSDMTAQDWGDVEPALVCLHSANGPECANEIIAYQRTTTSEASEALVMRDSPLVLSIGRRCHQEGWECYWELCKEPYVFTRRKTRDLRH